jgi:hypothetical protein
MSIQKIPAVMKPYVAEKMLLQAEITAAEKAKATAQHFAQSIDLLLNEPGASLMLQDEENRATLLLARDAMLRAVTAINSARVIASTVFKKYPKAG